MGRGDDLVNVTAVDTFKSALLESDPRRPGTRQDHLILDTRGMNGAELPFDFNRTGLELMA